MDIDERPDGKGPPDTGDAAAASTAVDPDPAEVTDPADPSWVEPAEGVPSADDEAER